MKQCYIIELSKLYTNTKFGQKILITANSGNYQNVSNLAQCTKRCTCCKIFKW